MDTGAWMVAESALLDAGLPPSFAAAVSGKVGGEMEWAALDALDSEVEKLAALVLWPQPCRCATDVACDYHGECACAAVDVWRRESRLGADPFCPRHPRPVILDEYAIRFGRLEVAPWRHFADVPVWTPGGSDA